MVNGQFSAVLRQIHRLLTSGSVAGLSEGQLLERFVARRDEVAFEALVARHGPMVLGVCRRWLRDPNDVEDAFQATFLVLVRKAGTLRRHDLLGNWLYGVAHRVALRARTSAARRHAREIDGVEALASPVESDPDRSEVCGLLQDEVARLPEKYRAPIVLCYLEGLTHEEAAEALRWPVGTVKGRLSRARALLRTRLSRRGLSGPGEAVDDHLRRGGPAVVPAWLLDSTVRAATTFAAREAAVAGLISAQAAAWAEGVLHAMFLTQLKTVVVVLCAGIVTTGAGVLADAALGSRSGPNPPAPTGITRAQSTNSTLLAQLKNRPASEPVAVEPGPGNPAPRAKDRAATPTPVEQPGKAYVDLALRALKVIDGRIEERRAELSDLEKYYQWSLRLMEAQRSGSGKAVQIAAIDAHRNRIRRLEQIASNSSGAGRLPPEVIFEWQFRRLQAEEMLAQARADQGSNPVQASPMPEPAPAPRMTGGMRPGGMGGGMMGGATNPAAVEIMQRGMIAQTSAEIADEDKTPQTQAILKKLDEPVAMSFPQETPLEDVLKYIKSATHGRNDNGIPIYVDPVGLREVEQTLATTVQLDLAGVPLKTTLRLMLKQLGLAYCVKDGVLFISSVHGVIMELRERWEPPGPRGLQ
jgi:RNA polymerase sigma factor (sigma-70 family)